MNDPLEKRFNEFEEETNRNMTMLLGQVWKQSEQLRLLKSQMIERFDRSDGRITELHKDLAELELEVRAMRQEYGQKLDEQGQKLDEQGQKLDEQGQKLDEQGQKLDQILQLLTSKNQP